MSTPLSSWIDGWSRGGTVKLQIDPTTGRATAVPIREAALAAVAPVAGAATSSSSSSASSSSEVDAAAVSLAAPIAAVQGGNAGSWFVYHSDYKNAEMCFNSLLQLWRDGKITSNTKVYDMYAPDGKSWTKISNDPVLLARLENAANL